MTVHKAAAMAGDTVEIHWTVPEGIFWHRVTCPPKATRMRRIEIEFPAGDAVNGADRVIEVSQIAKPAVGTVLVIRVGPGVDQDTIVQIAESIAAMGVFQNLAYLVVPYGVTIDATTREEIERWLKANPPTAEAAGEQEPKS